MNDEQLRQLLRQVDAPASPDPDFADRLFAQLTRTAGQRQTVSSALLLAAAIALLAAVAAGAVVGGLVKLPWLAVEVTPAPSEQPIASPAAPTSPSQTSEPSTSPSPPASPAPSAGGIAIDGLAKSTVDSLRVRAAPTTSADILGTIDTGYLGFVVAGPVSADGYAWYQLSAVGLPANAGCEPPVRTNPFNCPSWLGWVASGQPGGQAWLEATSVPCPASPMNLDALVTQAGPQGPLTALERLACYGSTPIRIRGWWPEIPPDAGLGGACGPGQSWLMCAGLYYNGLKISESEGFDGVGLGISINPASGVTMPPRGQWVEETAHLDDPAARDCAPSGGGDQDSVSVVLTCRAEVVADSVTPVTGPYPTN